MPRIEIALQVDVTSAIAVGGLGDQDSLADRRVARDAWGRLVLPGSHVKGRLRHACEQVARTLGLAVCQAPRAESMCPRAAGVSTPPCAVCKLFGSPALRGPLRWRDLPCLEEAATETGSGRRASRAAAPLPADLRAGIARSRRRGTVEAGRLFYLETSPPLPGAGLRFAHARAVDGRLEDVSGLTLLLAGCRLVASLGGGATRGLGWCALRADARVDGEPYAFDARALVDGARSPGAI